MSLYTITILGCIYRTSIGKFLYKFHKVDGLSSLSYNLVSITKERLFTKIVVKVDGPRSEKDMKQYFAKDITKLARQLKRQNAG